MRNPLAHGLPRGYALHRVGPTWLILDAHLQRELIDLRLADPDARDALFARAQQRGRGRAPTVALPDQTSLVLRRYRHGGLLGQLTRTWLWGPGRALREFDVTVRAERSEAPVPHVACVVTWPVLGPLWSALIGTVEIERGEDLLSCALRLPERADRTDVARRVGSSIRRLHDCGIAHPDLQLRNILVRWQTEASGSAPEVVVIDLDGATHYPHGVPVLRRAANLGRLLRSTVKLGLWGRRVGRRECAAFLAGYLGRDRALRRALRKTVWLESLKLLWHKLGYRMSGSAVRQASSGCASSTSITGMPSAMGKRRAQAAQSSASC